MAASTFLAMRSVPVKTGVSCARNVTQSWMLFQPGDWSEMKPMMVRVPLALRLMMCLRLSYFEMFSAPKRVRIR